jgi:bacteriocin biosynthesis cyclodehydratase domain-containing protein
MTGTIDSAVTVYRASAEVRWRDSTTDVSFYFPQKGTGTVLRGVGATLFRALAPALRRGATLRDACAATTLVDEATTSAFLATLVERGIAVSDVETAATAPDGLASRAVGICGSARLVSGVVARLRSMGATRMFVDAGAVAALGLPEAAADAVRPLEATTRLDLLVFVDDALHVERHRQLNREALRAGTRFLSVRLTRAGFELGPLVLPGKSACFDCYWTRLQAGVLEAPPAWVVTPDATVDAWEAPRHAADASVRAIAMEHVALEIARAVGGEGTPLALGALLEHDCTTLDTRRRPILEVPGCTACALVDPLAERDPGDGA